MTGPLAVAAGAGRRVALAADGPVAGQVVGVQDQNHRAQGANARVRSGPHVSRARATRADGATRGVVAGQPGVLDGRRAARPPLPLARRTRTVRRPATAPRGRRPGGARRAGGRTTCCPAACTTAPASAAPPPTGPADLEAARLRVMASRHRCGLVIVSRGHVPATPEGHFPSAEQAVGQPRSSAGSGLLAGHGCPACGDRRRLTSMGLRSSREGSSPCGPSDLGRAPKRSIHSFPPSPAIEEPATLLRGEKVLSPTQGGLLGLRETFHTVDGSPHQILDRRPSHRLRRRT
jgi:hypothetical protein